MTRNRRRTYAEHAHRAVQCNTCHETYTARPFICPDPLGNAQQRADRLADDWLRTHPCTPTPTMITNAINTNIRRKRAA